MCRNPEASKKRKETKQGLAEDALVRYMCCGACGSAQILVRPGTSCIPLSSRSADEGQRANNHYTGRETRRGRGWTQESQKGNGSGEHARYPAGWVRWVSQRSFFAQAGWLESAAATCSAEDGRWLWRRITADPRAGCARC